MDGETCLAVPPGDAGALALALGRLLDDPELRARLGAAGRERVLERFTWARAAQGTAELYRAAIARSAKAGAAKAGPSNARSSNVRPSDRESRTTLC